MTTGSAIVRRALIALALAAPLAGCGSSSSATSSSGGSSSSVGSSSAGSSKPAGAGSAAVAISGYAFRPPDVTVSVGAQVTFTNHDATAHTATSNQPAFDTGSLKPGGSRTVTLSKPGTFTYYCQFHPFMHGQVIVTG